jgi:hypothetical protein
VESGDRQLGRSGSGMWQAGTSKAIAPACVGYGPIGCLTRVSIEHTDRMLVFMGPVSLVVRCQQKLAFPHCFNGWFRREAGYRTMDHSVGMGLCREPFFSRVVDLFKSVDGCAKDCYMWTA